jgi:pimeloyl-ACP methyl ester carboxylesterase
VAQRAAPRFDLVGSLANVLAGLERAPERIHPDSEAGGALIGRFDLEWIVSEGLADPRVLRMLPLWLHKMEERDFSMIGAEKLLRKAWEALRRELPHSVGRYCMDCASGATAPRRALIKKEMSATLLGNTIDFPLPEICNAVNAPDLGDEFRSAPRSGVPVLFITGTLDCRTPAENVADLAPGLPNHQHVVVEDAGHSDLLLATAAQSAVLRFARAQDLETTRVRADTPFEFEIAWNHNQR